MYIKCQSDTLLWESIKVVVICKPYGHLRLLLSYSAFLNEIKCLQISTSSIDFQSRNLAAYVECLFKVSCNLRDTLSTERAAIRCFLIAYLQDLIATLVTVDLLLREITTKGILTITLFSIIEYVPLILLDENKNVFHAILASFSIRYILLESMYILDLPYSRMIVYVFDLVPNKESAIVLTCKRIQYAVSYSSFLVLLA